MRRLVLACSLLLACSEVTIVPNDGGGSASDGVGGGVSVGAGTPGTGGAPKRRRLRLNAPSTLHGGGPIFAVRESSKRG